MTIGSLAKQTASILAITAAVVLAGCGERKPHDTQTPKKGAATATAPNTATASVEPAATPAGEPVLDLRDGSSDKVSTPTQLADLPEPVKSPAGAAPATSTTPPAPTQAVAETPAEPAPPAATGQAKRADLPAPPTAQAANGQNAEPSTVAEAATPYVRNAAKSAVKWLPWSTAAFQLASQKDCPVLIDIGAGWCHWCHMMDAETYEDADVAAILNRDFVAIKVDRDERPDVDERYQAANRLINPKKGGWPLTVFALPDGRAFESLGYVPPVTRDGVTGMNEILQQVLKAYKERRPDINKQADLIEKAIAPEMRPTTPETDIKDGFIKRVRTGLAESLDKENGGFGRSDQSKFPNGSALLFLLHFGSDYADGQAIDAVRSSLTAYSKGALRDHVLGGYFRYTVDGRFRDPHFEKMLYVQAELLSANAYTYAATGKKDFRDNANEILKFMRDTLERKDGGFYSSQDADLKPGENGTYYTWVADEVRKIAGNGTDTQVFLNYLGVMEGQKGDRVAPRAGKPLRDATDAAKVPYESGQSALDTVRAKLREARLAQEEAPYVDKTLNASWNGQMISAYLDAYKYLGDRQARDFALQSMDFILQNMVSQESGVAHTFSRGKAHGPGLLADQVQMAHALIDCFEVSNRTEYLESAESLMNFVEGMFLDETTGMYLDRIADAKAPGFLKVPHIEIWDSSTPSANAMATLTWQRLALATGKLEYVDRATRILKTAAAQEAASAVASSTFGRAALLGLNSAPKALIIGDETDTMTLEMREAALPVFRPGKIVEIMTPAQAEKTDYKASKDGKPIAYVCTLKNCDKPARQVPDLVTKLRSFGKPAPVAAPEAKPADSRKEDKPKSGGDRSAKPAEKPKKTPKPDEKKSEGATSRGRQETTGRTR